jgi:hypothetical protein
MYIFNVPDKILIETAISYTKLASKRHFFRYVKTIIIFQFN